MTCHFFKVTIYRVVLLCTPYQFRSNCFKISCLRQIGVFFPDSVESDVTHLVITKTSIDPLLFPFFCSLSYLFDMKFLHTIQVVSLLVLAIDSSTAFQTPVTKTARSSTALAAATLYGHQGTRSPLVNWGANEVGFDLIMGDLSKNPHPFGQLPCLTNDDGVLVFESGAILQYLHSQTNSQMSKADAAAVTSWITWANASLDPICFLETPDGKVYDTGLKKPNKRLTQLDQMLSQRKYLLGDAFSLADVAVASYLLYVLQFFPGIDVSPWPNMKRYMKDCASRESYAKAFGKNVQAVLMEQLSQESPKKLFGMF